MKFICQFKMLCILPCEKYRAVAMWKQIIQKIMWKKLSLPSLISICLLWCDLPQQKFYKKNITRVSKLPRMWELWALQRWGSNGRRLLVSQLWYCLSFGSIIQLHVSNTWWAMCHLLFFEKKVAYVPFVVCYVACYPCVRAWACFVFRFFKSFPSIPG